MMKKACFLILVIAVLLCALPAGAFAGTAGGIGWPAGPVGCSGEYDLVKPELYGAVYSRGMNMAVFWVQAQLKATGEYYQNTDERWDVTGNLGDHTREEIARFMRDRGYCGHNGNIDQNVIDELYYYVGWNRVPVYAGGIYDRMDSLMIGGSSGSMVRIEGGSSGMGICWVQVCLSKLGYYHGPVDGAFSSMTAEAVRGFQRDYGFAERDYVTLGVARRMLEVCRDSGCGLYDLP